MKHLRQQHLIQHWSDTCVKQEQLTSLVQSLLPEYLRDYLVQVSKLKEKHWYLVINQSSAYFPMVQHLELLKKSLASLGQTEITLKVKVAVTVSAPVAGQAVDKEESLSLNQRALGCFKALQQRVQHPKLKMSIDRLISRHSDESEALTRVDADSITV